eukprot:651720-Pleurochrysis_carterae.AAC.1
MPTPRRFVLLDRVWVVSERLECRKVPVQLLVHGRSVGRQVMLSELGQVFARIGATVGVRPYAKGRGEGRGVGRGTTASGRASAGCRGIGAGRK